MKALVVILTLILAQQVSANNSCFQNKEVMELVQAAEALDDCFSDDQKVNSVCELNKKSTDEQAELNSLRLAPFDRTSRNGFWNNATGRVSMSLDGKNASLASAQKISRCHIVTSAHFLYGNGNVGLQSKNLDVNFYSGQTCNSEYPFENKVNAKVMFSMTKENVDFKCINRDQNGNCESRYFLGHSDLVILKLTKYDKNDKKFFKVNVNNPSSHKIGQKVICQGYPVHNENLRLSKSISDSVLWMQKDAKIYGDNNGSSERGMITNAVVYKGMSGGGCSLSSDPQQLIGIYANGNSSNGKSAITIKPSSAASQGANYLSSFHVLNERLVKERGTSIADLDKECD